MAKRNPSYTIRTQPGIKIPLIIKVGAKPTPPTKTVFARKNAFGLRRNIGTVRGFTAFTKNSAGQENYVSPICGTREEAIQRAKRARPSASTIYSREGYNGRSTAHRASNIKSNPAQRRKAKPKTRRKVSSPSRKVSSPSRKKAATKTPRKRARKTARKNVVGRSVRKASYAICGYVKRGRFWVNYYWTGTSFSDQFSRRKIFASKHSAMERAALLLPQLPPQIAFVTVKAA